MAHAMDKLFKEDNPFESSTSSSTFACGIAMELQQIQSQAQRLRMRVTILLLLAGGIPSSGGVIIYYVQSWNVVIGLGHPVAYLSCTPCALFMLLAVLPTDVFLIRALSVIVVMAAANTSAWCVAHAVWLARGFEHGRCRSSVQVCHSTIFVDVCIAGVWFVYSVALIPSLRRRTGTWAMPVRMVLLELWRCARCAMCAQGLIFIVHSCFCLAVDPAAVTEWTSRCIVGLQWFVSAAVATHRNRGLVQGWLRGLVAQGETSNAGVVASMVSNRPAQEVITNAKSMFRACRFDTLSPQVLDSNCDGSCITPVHAAKLGSVDVFLSHSWHDPGDLKWSALQSWAEAFPSIHGHPPTLWIDKLCIDQNDIERSLLCLPVFLAGCRRLLVLLGSTYGTRLWCVLELFTFLRMGASWERVEVLRVNSKVANLLWDFDVRSAQCFKQAERQRLLGIIEAGFCNLDSFNDIVRQMLRGARASISRDGDGDGLSGHPIVPVVHTGGADKAAGTPSESSGCSTRFVLSLDCIAQDDTCPQLEASSISIVSMLQADADPQSPDIVAQEGTPRQPAASSFRAMGTGDTDTSTRSIQIERDGVSADTGLTMSCQQLLCVGACS